MPRGNARRVLAGRDSDRASLAIAFVIAWSLSAAAQQPQPKGEADCDPACTSPDNVTYAVDVTAVTPRTAASGTALRTEMFAHVFLESPADVLRAVPGLVIAQHGGGGKSDQYLIRGFDADHGTDIQVSVDGVPVNMVSHAHGQGYADLHFVIPETVERIDVHKGPYYAEFGNLATAGALQLITRDRFERSFVRVQGGSFGAGRLVFGLAPSKAPAWLAGEAVVTDGPFRHPQDFTRLNVAGKWRRPIRDAHNVTVSGGAYKGSWNGSGQIPARLVDSGGLGRFDAIDPSEGGETLRAHAGALYAGALGSTRVVAQSYVLGYSLDLFSNFTFFARNSDTGDGILQRDRRTVWGGRVRVATPHMIGPFRALATAGTEWRRDAIDVALEHQQRRMPLGTVVDSTIAERDLGVHAQEEILFDTRLRAILGVRHDRLAFNVRAVESGPRGRLSAAFTGPKASIILSPAGESDVQLFANYGRGFHSNDARAAVSDPTAPVLPKADGYELGLRRTLGRRAELAAAWWLLDLESEFTWVGDEGTTEAGAATRRHGVEIEARWRVAPPLWAEIDLTASRGRYRESGDLIARAPRLTINTAAVLTDWKGWSGQLRVRHVGDHAAVSDGSVDATGFTLTDLHVRRRLSEQWDAMLSVENLFDGRYREAQTFFASRLASEPMPVDDIHFTPGYPRAIRIGFEYRFDLP